MGEKRGAASTIFAKLGLLKITGSSFLTDPIIILTRLAVRPYFLRVVVGCSYSMPKWRLFILETVTVLYSFTSHYCFSCVVNESNSSTLLTFTCFLKRLY